MASHGVEVERLALHRPTLDEAFLTLTDRPTDTVPADRDLEPTAR